MPRVRFMVAAAHELMHIWQYLNAPADNSPALREGSCNLAAYLVLSRHRSKEAEYIEQGMLASPDPIYGEGFRRAKSLAEEKGVPYWLDWLKQHLEFPDGY